MRIKFKEGPKEGPVPVPRIIFNAIGMLFISAICILVGLMRFKGIRSFEDLLALGWFAMPLLYFIHFMRSLKQLKEIYCLEKAESYSDEKFPDELENSEDK